jgi:hypothetical protein
MNNDKTNSTTKPLKYGRKIYYSIVLILIILHYIVWIKPLLKYWKLL